MHSGGQCSSRIQLYLQREGNNSLLYCCCHQQLIQNMRLKLRCCISYSERKQRMMIKLWIDRKLKEIMSPGTKSFPIFNDFERNYFFGFKSEPSFSPPSSVWTWQSLSVCLALIVLLVFLVIELDYLPSVLQYLSTRRKHLGDFNYVHFVLTY